jgi:hypothetical protein
VKPRWCGAAGKALDEEWNLMCPCTFDNQPYTLSKQRAQRIRRMSSMEVVSQSTPAMVEVQSSGVSWPAIAAGAVATAALTLVLVAFGAGLGLSAISPWADSGVSATTFKVGTGIYLCAVAVMASAVGGYLAARLRTKWTGFHTNEVFFRDTAHGMLAWAFATLLIAGVLSGATTRLVSGVAQGAGVVGAQAGSQAAQSTNPAEIYVDKLFRSGAMSQPAAAAQPPAGAASPAQPASPSPAGTDARTQNGAMRGEMLRLWTSSFRESGDVSAADRTYAARLVAARTGLSQSDAEKRVNDVVTEAKATADQTRKAAAEFSFWLAASLLLGAFAASLAAVEGGQLRDGTWTDRVLTPRSI